MKNNLIIILCTINSKKLAKKIAVSAIEKKLTACVNIIDKIISIFYWENKIQKLTEYQMIFKTSKNKYKQLIDFINKNHNYNTPEIISINVDEVNIDYEKWILDYLK